MTSTTSAYGEVINIDDISKASRGAQATYDEGLLAWMPTALAKGKAGLIGSMAVLRADYSSEDDYRNAKQAVGAELRKHFRKLVEDGKVPEGSKLSINWHPENGSPQISLKG